MNEQVKAILARVVRLEAQARDFDPADMVIPTWALADILTEQLREYEVRVVNVNPKLKQVFRAYCCPQCNHVFEVEEKHYNPFEPAPEQREKILSKFWHEGAGLAGFDKFYQILLTALGQEPAPQGDCNNLPKVANKHIGSDFNEFYIEALEVTILDLTGKRPEDKRKLEAQIAKRKIEEFWETEGDRFLEEYLQGHAYKKWQLDWLDREDE